MTTVRLDVGKLLRALFPGERRVWLCSLVVLIPVLALLGYSLQKPRPTYTSTNSIGALSAVQGVNPGQKLCVPGVPLAAGTGALQLAYTVTYNHKGLPPIVDTSLVRNGKVLASGSTATVPPDPPGKNTILLNRTLPSSYGDPLGSVCITVKRASIVLWGFEGSPTDGPVPHLDGKPINPRWSVSVWLLPPGAQQRSLIDNWASIMHRLTLFRPGFAGDVMYWFLFIGVLPLLSYFALRLLAVARLPGRRIVLGLILISFVGSVAWAITTAAFDAPDESEHYAYVQHLAETGQAPLGVPSTSPMPPSPYSTDETYALDAVNHFSSIEADETRPPWAPAQVHAWQRRVKEHPPSTSDGGGLSAATGQHSPLYYSLLIPGYELGHSKGVFTELFWMRVTSALLGIIVVLGAYFTLRELLPRRPELAVAGGLLVAFEPMFSFMTGAVNNDNGVNAMCALAIYLTVRALRRGLTWRLGLCLGVAAALAPVMKATGLAIVPAIVVAVLAILWRDRRRLFSDRSFTTLKGAVATLAGFLVVIGIWAIIAPHFHRGTFGVPGTGAGPSTSLTSKLTYVWEVMFPWLRLPFMAQHVDPGTWPFKYIYAERGFAAFGWVDDVFPSWVYTIIIIVMIGAALLAIDMAWNRRETVIRYWREAVFMILAIAGMYVGVEFNYYQQTPTPQYLTGEQGRYAFTALVPLACLALVGLVRFKREWAFALATMLVTAMIGFAFASHLLYLTDTFM